MQHPDGQAVGQVGVRGVEPSPAGEQGEGPATGGEDQALQFGVDGVPEAGLPRVGQVGGAVQEGLALEVEGAADVLGPVPVLGESEAVDHVGWQGGAGEHRRAPRPELFGQHRCHDDRRLAEHRAVAGALHPGDVAVVGVKDRPDVAEQAFGRELRALRPRLGLGGRVVGDGP